MMDIREASYNADGSINCMISHPRYGWIPYTAREDDPDTRGAKIWCIAKAHIDGLDPPDVGDDELQPPSPEELMRRARLARRVDKLALVRNLRALDRWDDFKAALAAAGSDVEEDWQIAGSIGRLDPVFLRIFAHLGMTEEDTDIAFGMKRIGGAG